MSTADPVLTLYGTFLCSQHLPSQPLSLYKHSYPSATVAVLATELQPIGSGDWLSTSVSDSQGICSVPLCSRAAHSCCRLSPSADWYEGEGEANQTCNLLPIGLRPLKLAYRCSVVQGFHLLACSLQGLGTGDSDLLRCPSFPVASQ